MQKFIDFILKNKEHFVFLGLLFIALSLILLGDINKIGGFRTIVVASLGWFQKKVFFIPNVSALKSENSALRELNFNLSQKVMNARIAEIENQTLRNLLGLKQRMEYSVEVAQVVGTVTIDMRNYYLIDKGKNYGIDKNMTVRNDAGLVGIVVLSGNNYSLVEPIISVNLKVPAMNLRSGVLGIINWDGSKRLLFRDVAKFFDVKIGDTIVTSKYSLKFIPYVPIGTVVSKSEEEGELFTSIVVKPFVNFSFLEEVFVIKQVVDEEIVKLIKDYEERLKTINLPPDKNQKLQPKEMIKQKQKQDSIEKRQITK
ncbi:MAG: rod shape-determining protein MreC [Ignavibacteria bacterium]|nr:rod shape-determining protein MreC [Ignavibacteria bacterium]